MTFLKKSILLFLISLSFTALSQSQTWLSEYDEYMEKGSKLWDEFNYQSAVNEFLKAYQLSEEGQDTIRIIDSGLKVSDGLLQSEKPTEALEFLSKFESYFSPDISSTERVKFLVTQGGCYNRLGQTQEMMNIYREALRIGNPEREPVMYGNLLLNLSYGELEYANYDTTIELSKRALKIFTRIENLSLISKANLSIYIAYLFKGNMDAGEPYLFESYNIARNTNEPKDLRNAYQYLSDFYQRKRDFANALSFAEQGLQIAQQIGQSQYIARYYERLAEIYRFIQEPDRALSYYNRSLGIYQSIGNEAKTIQLLRPISYCFIQKGDYEEAEKLQLQILEHYTQDCLNYQIAFTLEGLGRTALLSEDYLKALEYLTKSSEIANEFDLKRIEHNALWAMMDLPEEFLPVTRRREITKRLYSLSETLDARHELRSLEYLSEMHSTSSTDSAFYYANQAFEKIEQQRLSSADGILRADIFAPHATFYNTVGSWHASINEDFESAFELFESSKSRVLLDELAEKNAPELELSPEDQIELQQYQKQIDQLFRQKESARSQNEIQALDHEITDAKFEYEVALERIRKAHPEWSSFVYPERVRLNDAQKLLDSDSGILYFSFIKNGLALMLITKGEVYYHQIDREYRFRNKLAREINAFRDAIINVEDKAVLDSLSRPLYGQLFAPFENQLGSISNLAVIPDGPISLLPLGALMHDGSYLVNRFTIKSLPSVTSYLKLNDPHRKTEKDLFAVAGSGFEEGDTFLGSKTQNAFAALPFTLIEADSVSSHFEESYVLKNDAVTEAGIKNVDISEYRYLHFATHGNIDEVSPRQSGLILSKKSEMERLFGEDGYLNAVEISSFDISADLVVLSACNTATGKVMNGEGLLGLQRSFLVAGASSVVASLWSIYDRSTPLFMNKFYENLVEMEDEEIGFFDRISLWFNAYEPELFDYKTKALREAKLEMLDHPYYDHPVHWASFVITGK